MIQYKVQVKCKLHSKSLRRISNEDDSYRHYRRIRITPLLTNDLKESTKNKTLKDRNFAIFLRTILVEVLNQKYKL